MGSVEAVSPDPYAVLGVAEDASDDELRRAFRARIAELHPDRTGSDGPDVRRAFTRLTNAWAQISSDMAAGTRTRTLSDAGSDGTAIDGTRTDGRPSQGRTRREAWGASLGSSIRRLGLEAARSAAQTVALRHHRARGAYDPLVEEIVAGLGTAPEATARSVRAMGAAPLDLALAGALHDTRRFMVQLAGRVYELDGPVPSRMLAMAEMLDRMFDTLAHGLRHDLVQALGGNPHLHRHLVRR